MTIAKCLVVSPTETSDSGQRKPIYLMTVSQKESETSSDTATFPAAAGPAEIVSGPSCGGARNLTASSKTAPAVMKNGELTTNVQTKEAVTWSYASPPLVAADSRDVVSGPPFAFDGNIATSRIPAAESDGRASLARYEMNGVRKNGEKETAADVAALLLEKAQPCAVDWQGPENTSRDDPSLYWRQTAVQPVLPGPIAHRATQP